MAGVSLQFRRVGNGALFGRPRGQSLSRPPSPGSRSAVAHAGKPFHRDFAPYGFPDAVGLVIGERFADCIQAMDRAGGYRHPSAVKQWLSTGRQFSHPARLIIKDATPMTQFIGDHGISRPALRALTGVTEIGSILRSLHAGRQDSPERPQSEGAANHDQSQSLLVPSGLRSSLRCACRQGCQWRCGRLQGRSRLLTHGCNLCRRDTRKQGKTGALDNARVALSGSAPTS
jgi:hypothetical protein